MMKIKDVTEIAIIFDNGDEITFDHYQECCEDNYADFKQIDTIGKEHDYSAPLRFEKVDGYGFRFGDGQLMTFIPCYSDQNGYYSSDVDIYYKGKQVLNLECEMV